jgi:hypothetical protein
VETARRRRRGGAADWLMPHLAILVQKLPCWMCLMQDFPRRAGLRSLLRGHIPGALSLLPEPPSVAPPSLGRLQTAVLRCIAVPRVRLHSSPDPRGPI